MADSPMAMPPPEAERVVSECGKRLMAYRSECQENIEMHKHMAEFWSREHDIVTHFMVSDFFGDVKPVAPDEQPRASNPKPPW